MITLAQIRKHIEPESRSPKRYTGLFGTYPRGSFFGEAPFIQVLGPKSFHFIPSKKDPWGFRRSTGEVIIPEEMTTDAGTIPRIAWCIPDLDPWNFSWAYFCHDWCFEVHRRDNILLSFENTNLMLAEAIRTLIDMEWAEGSWLDVELIYRAVSSSEGRKLWDIKKG